MSEPLPAPAREAPPSRLSPQPVARRDFLGLAATYSALLALGAAALGMLRLPKAAVLPSPSKKFKVALPESLAPNTPFPVAGRSVALFRDPGGVFAISLVCTHLGCIVKPTPEGFDCPCHGSRFHPDGAVRRGPAPQALSWLAVSRVAPNTYLVDEGKTVPAGTRVQA